MNLADTFRALTRGSDAKLVHHLVEQITATYEGAELAHKLVTDALSSATARDAIGDIEHQGDDSRAALISELGRALTTPIDREDLFRLSSSIDDILDNLRDFVREHDLFGVEPSPWHEPVVEAVMMGIKELERSLYHLSDEAAQAGIAALSAKKVANNVRRMYQEQLAALLDQPVDGDTLKHRELLRRLDVVGLRLRDAADALADGVKKRGH